MARLDESLSGWRAGGEQARRRKLQDAKTPQSKPRPKRRPVPSPVDTPVHHADCICRYCPACLLASHSLM
jgi:hypothetical protein